MVRKQSDVKRQPRFEKPLNSKLKTREENKNNRNNSRLEKDTKLNSLNNRGGNKNRKSRCAISNRCGGCQYIDTLYEEQLSIKQKYINNILKDFGKVESIIGMDHPYHYRNKVHAVFHHKRNGEIISGVYEEGTHNVLPVTTCYIENEKADQIIADITDLLKSFKITVYNEDSGYGLLRHVLIRTGHISGQVLVVLVTTSPVFPSKNNFVKALLKRHPDITTIIQNINNKQTSMVLGDREQVMYGKGYIEDTLCGKTFRISPKSFYQVNPVQTEVLYNKAIEFAGLTKKERVIDAYCGIGTIGIIASRQAKEVIGVELNKDAVRDARINAKINNVDNIEFYNNDAGTFMLGLAARSEKIDVVFMDPPRSGSDQPFMSSVLKLMPEKIVYISCGPESLARDLKYLTKSGAYKVVKMGAVDMFPMTGHVECVVLLSKVQK